MTCYQHNTIPIFSFNSRFAPVIKSSLLYKSSTRNSRRTKLPKRIKISFSSGFTVFTRGNTHNKAEIKAKQYAKEELGISFAEIKEGEVPMEKQITEEVNALTDLSIFSLLELIKKINPMRYKDLEVKYINYYTQTCGLSILFAIENLQYLFLLVTSACYRTSLTGFSLNKIVQTSAKRVQMILVSMNL